MTLHTYILSDKKNNKKQTKRKLNKTTTTKRHRKWLISQRYLILPSKISCLPIYCIFLYANNKPFLVPTPEIEPKLHYSLHFNKNVHELFGHTLCTYTSAVDDISQSTYLAFLLLAFFVTSVWTPASTGLTFDLNIKPFTGPGSNSGTFRKAFDEI